MDLCSENIRIVCPNCNATLPTHCRGHKYIEGKKNKDELNESVDLIFVEQEADKNTLYQTIEKVGEVKDYLK